MWLLAAGEAPGDLDLPWTVTEPTGSLDEWRLRGRDFGVPRRRSMRVRRDPSSEIIAVNECDDCRDMPFLIDDHLFDQASTGLDLLKIIAEDDHNE